MTDFLKKYQVVGTQQLQPTKSYQLYALWLVVAFLVGLRGFDFYQGTNQVKPVNSVVKKVNYAAIWKNDVLRINGSILNLKKGQAEIVEYLEDCDSYEYDD